jgi:hypothetical protein
MARYSVPVTTLANTAVEVEVPDSVTDPAQIAALALEQNNPPTLCNQCSGGRHGQELEVGDDWEPVIWQGAPTVTRIA